MAPLFVLALMAIPGCDAGEGGDVAEVSLAGETAVVSTTLPAEWPCFGLAQGAALPDWAGGLAFGEYHDLGGGSFVDLTSLVGCEIEEGVLTVNEETEDRLFGGAYVEDCDGFQSSDIPPEELRPAVDDRWICREPLEGGGLGFTQREG